MTTGLPATRTTAPCSDSISVSFLNVFVSSRRCSSCRMESIRFMASSPFEFGAVFSGLVAVGFMPAFKHNQKILLEVLGRGHKAHGYVHSLSSWLIWTVHPLQGGEYHQKKVNIPRGRADKEIGASRQ